MDEDASGYRRRWFLKVPSYEASFRTFVNRVEIAEPLQADPTSAAAQIISALKAGRVCNGDRAGGPCDARVHRRGYEGRDRDARGHLRFRPAGQSRLPLAPMPPTGT